MWPWAWESPEEDGHWAGKRTKPREQHQVSSDMDPDLVGADLQDVGGKESEGSRGGVRRCLQATPGDGWTAAQRPAPPRGQRALSPCRWVHLSDQCAGEGTPESTAFGRAGLSADLPCDCRRKGSCQKGVEAQG